MTSLPRCFRPVLPASAPLRKCRWQALLVLTLAVAGLSSVARAQAPARIQFFAGAVLDSPSGFLGGVGGDIPVTRNVTFNPTVALGRAGHTTLFTLDGSFAYHFATDEPIKPYIFAGVGLSQWGSATHGSPILGVGADFITAPGFAIRPEIRWGDNGLGRFTIGISKRF